MHIYDPLKGFWMPLDPTGSVLAPEPRSCAGFAVSGDKFYIFGGYGTSGVRQCAHSVGGHLVK